jgi:hypothetical protein
LPHDPLKDVDRVSNVLPDDTTKENEYKIDDKTHLSDCVTSTPPTCEENAPNIIGVEQKNNRKQHSHR